jgi:hypothetical protein
MTLFWLRIPFLILFLALTMWLVYSIYTRGRNSKWP